MSETITQQQKRDQRIKNAKLKKHYIADPAYPDHFMRLGKYVTEANDGSEDITEDGVAWYDGDGTVSEEITGYTERTEFVGTYGEDEEAMRYLNHIRRDPGNREVIWKVENANGTTEVGLATASNIITGGGNAGEFGQFATTLTRKEAPTVTDAEGKEYTFEHPADPASV
ncbi:phage tail tube protein [Facklamia sp. P13064]|uniref:phage tail tube protein n=1 Tax=Facklamia sp. P13064 TaxID=3421953 RepID=UPI003D1783ED